MSTLDKLAHAGGLALMAVAVLLASPFAALLAMCCLLGVWRSHGGIGPQRQPEEPKNEQRDKRTAA